MLTCLMIAVNAIAAAYNFSVGGTLSYCIGALNIAVCLILLVQLATYEEVY